MAVSRAARTAIIAGAGLMGQWHARAAVRAGATIVAIVDPDEAKAKSLAKTHAGCRTATRLDDVDARDGSVLHITSPSATHVAIARAGLARGWHVLVEKPVAADGAATEALLNQADACGRLLCPVHQFLFQPGVQHILARRASLGDLVRASFTIASAGAEGRPQEAEAIAFDILPHPLALIERIAPGSLGRAQWMVAAPRPGELAAVADAGGIAVTIAISMHARPTVNELVVAGTRATAQADLFHGFGIIEAGEVSKRRKITRPFGRAAMTLASAGSNLARRAATRQEAYPGLWELTRAFYDAVSARGPSPISAAETLSVARAGDAVRAAIPS